MIKNNAYFFIIKKTSLTYVKRVNVATNMSTTQRVCHFFKDILSYEQSYVFSLPIV